MGEHSDLEFPSGQGACAAWVYQPDAARSRAPKGELHRYPYDHWEPCAGDAPERIAADQVDFLSRQGLLGV